MDNIPFTNDIHDNISNGEELQYINDSNFINDSNNFCQVSWNNSLIPCQKIENLNNIQTLDCNIKEIINIYNDLILLDTFEIPKGYEDDKEVNEISEKLDKFSKSFHEIREDLLKQKDKTLLLQAEFKKNDEKLQSDIQKISDFKEFAFSINTKYKDLDTNKLNETILELSTQIKNNHNNEIKEKYMKENHILNLYLYKFIKEINGCNNGSTCSLCLQNKVDTFMEPCGHTGCSECIEKLKERSGGEFNCNCFLCRKSVMKFHKLYFT